MAPDAPTPRTRRPGRLTAEIVLVLTLAIHGSAIASVIATGAWHLVAIGFATTSAVYFCAWWWGVERRIIRADRRVEELQHALDQAQPGPAGILSFGLQHGVWCEPCLAHSAIRHSATLTNSDGATSVQHHHCPACDDCGLTEADGDSR